MTHFRLHSRWINFLTSSIFGLLWLSLSSTTPLISFLFVCTIASFLLICQIILGSPALFFFYCSLFTLLHHSFFIRRRGLAFNTFNYIPLDVIYLKTRRRSTGANYFFWSGGSLKDAHHDLISLTICTLYSSAICNIEDRKKNK